jgi:regulator of sigma E protease
MTVLISIIAFAAAISVLVSFHEFGHYSVAKRLGVKVLKFSVGFGYPLWRRTAGVDRTEYVLAAIPLGGYVKMLDEREGQVDARELHRAFNRQPVGARIAIVAAGPLFNFLLAIAAYWLMFMIGVAGVKPVIGDVAPDTIAARAGLKSQDEILAVGQESTPTWEAATIGIINEALKEGEVAVTVRSQGGNKRQHALDFTDTRQVLGEENVLGALGITPWQPPIEPVLGQLAPGGAAEHAGLKPRDRIVSADGRPIAKWQDWVDYVRAHPNHRARLKIERRGEPLTLMMRIGVEVEDGREVGRIGAYPHIDRARIEAMQVNVRHGPLVALGLAAEQTYDFSMLTLRVLWQLITGGASLKNVSGPITIAQFAGVSAAIGLSAFLGAIAIFSISIGILNLLPVPVLDGGHLLYYFIEVVKGSPVSESAQAMGQRVGLAVLACLMALAFYNDFVRLIG